MNLHIGSDVVISQDELIAIFDYERIKGSAKSSFLQEVDFDAAGIPIEEIRSIVLYMLDGEVKAVPSVIRVDSLATRTDEMERIKEKYSRNTVHIKRKKRKE